MTTPTDWPPTWHEARGYDRAHPPEVPEGCTLIEAGPGQLLLDLDGEHAVRRFVLMLGLIHPFGPYTIRCWASRSKGMHALLDFSHCAFWPAEKFALQSMLGSDPKREMALMRDCILRGLPEAEQNVLFKPVRTSE